MIGKLGSWIREFTEDQAVSPTQETGAAPLLDC